MSYGAMKFCNHIKNITLVLQHNCDTMVCEFKIHATLEFGVLGYHQVDEKQVVVGVYRSKSVDHRMDI